MLLRLWKLSCSLKLAIYLASAATLLFMGGSLLIPAYPLIFSGMDRLVLGHWLSQVAWQNLPKTWWLYLAGSLMVIFGLNTFCCLCDWLAHLKSRWRKAGEYLLHLGVILVLVAFLWGSQTGWRQTNLSCQIGKRTPLAGWPGHFLRLEDFRPVFAQSGPPLDMISEISLLRDQEVLQKTTVRINQPYLQDGLVITPASFDTIATGFMVSLDGQRPFKFIEGSRIILAPGADLQVLRFLPDAQRNANGIISARSERLANPAFELKYTDQEGRWWQGWYFVGQPAPPILTNLGIFPRPVRPIFETLSILTVTYDPGAPLAAVGGCLMSVGVVLALFSFYRKRSRQDRPEV